MTKSEVKAELADKMQKSLGLDREKVRWDPRLQQSEMQLQIVSLLVEKLLVHFLFISLSG